MNKRLAELRDQYSFLMDPAIGTAIREIERLLPYYYLAHYIATDRDRDPTEQQRDWQQRAQATLARQEGTADEP
jgi:glucosamine 6-phosphate synthetase-like amidotransferase/phosphosugar isomerase protein